MSFYKPIADHASMSEFKNEEWLDKKFLKLYIISVLFQTNYCRIFR